jgi:hypothetical protein
MAYSEQLAEKVRNYLGEVPAIDVVEKSMMGGLTFMVNDKMCVGVVKDDLMVRFDPQQHEAILSRDDCREMDFIKTRISRGFVFVNDQAIENPTVFNFWMKTALDFNKIAKISKKRK